MKAEIVSSKTEYDNFIKIIEFINNHIVRIHNLIIDELGKEEN